MTALKNIGLSLMIIGLLITLYTAFILVFDEKLIDLGSVQVTKERSNQMLWSPLAGVLIMLLGSGFLVFGTRKTN
jgi:hypothetical protein